jgi:hypothetical protein
MTWVAVSRDALEGRLGLRRLCTEAKHGAGHYRQNTTRNSHLCLPVICFIEDLLTEPISSECVHLTS